MAASSIINHTMNLMLPAMGNRTVRTDACGWPLDSASEDYSGTATEILTQFDLVSFPFFLALTTIGNVLNLLVLCSGKVGGGGKNAYLIAIALIDLVIIWNSVWTYVVNYDAALHDGDTQPSVMTTYNYVAGVIIYLGEACLLASGCSPEEAFLNLRPQLELRSALLAPRACRSFLVAAPRSRLIVAFSLERYLAIRFPLKNLVSSHGRRTIAVVIGIVLSAFIFVAPRLWDYYWVFDNYLRFSPRPRIKPGRPPALQTWVKFYHWAQIIIQIGTFSVILILNVLLLLTILHQKQQRHKKLQAISSTESSRADWFALPLLASCVVLYLATQIPGLIGNILFLLEKNCVSQLNVYWQPWLRPLQNIFLNVYVSVNFLLYCGVNAKFRESLSYLIPQLLGLNRRHSSESSKSTNTTHVLRASNPKLAQI